MLGTQKVFNVMHKVATRSFKPFKISSIVLIKMVLEKHANINFRMTVNVEFLNVNVHLVILWRDVQKIRPKLAGGVIQTQIIAMSVRNAKKQIVIDILVSKDNEELFTLINDESPILNRLLQSHLFHLLLIIF